MSWDDEGQRRWLDVGVMAIGRVLLLIPRLITGCIPTRALQVG